mgnify:CR=1 FL=1
MGNFISNMFGKRKKVSTDRLKGYLSDWQDMTTEQADMSRQMMDPMSGRSMQMMNMYQTQAATTGQMAASEARKIAAMTGMSPAQAQMQARQGMMSAGAQGLQQFQQGFQGQQQLGMQGFTNAMSNQQGLNENIAQGYISQIQADNAARGANMSMATDFATGILSDRRMKKDIKKVGSLDNNNLPLYSYKYKGDSSNKTHIGLMAQDVERVRPSAVIANEAGVKFVNYKKATV